MRGNEIHITSAGSGVSSAGSGVNGIKRRFYLIPELPTVEPCDALIILRED